MKVDIGQCAVCGAKNSKYVEKCYKCGAALPWAPGYVAPKNAPQPAPQPAMPRPASTSVGADAKTIVVPPLDVSAQPNARPNVQPATPQNAPTVAERAQSKVQVPAWAIGVGGLGLLVLGMALWALLGSKPAPAPATVPAPGATASAPALAPIAPDANAVAPDLTPSATPALTPEATDQPTVSAAGATAAGATAAPVPGPTFDELYANLTTGTPQQQSLYWESVKNTKIGWRGEFLSLGNAATGPLVVNCKAAKGALKVRANLDAKAPQTLPSYAPGQSVPFEGILESRSAGEITVKDARAG